MLMDIIIPFFGNFCLFLNDLFIYLYEACLVCSVIYFASIFWHFFSKSRYFLIKHISSFPSAFLLTFINNLQFWKSHYKFIYKVCSRKSKENKLNVVNPINFPQNQAIAIVPENFDVVHRMMLQEIERNTANHASSIVISNERNTANHASSIVISNELKDFYKKGFNRGVNLTYFLMLLILCLFTGISIYFHFISFNLNISPKFFYYVGLFCLLSFRIFENNSYFPLYSEDLRQKILNAAVQIPEGNESAINKLHSSDLCNLLFKTNNYMKEAVIRIFSQFLITIITNLGSNILSSGLYYFFGFDLLLSTFVIFCGFFILLPFIAGMLAVDINMLTFTEITFLALASVDMNIWDIWLLSFSLEAFYLLWIEVNSKKKITSIPIGR